MRIQGTFGSLAQRDFEISGQRGRHSRAGRSVRAPAHLHLSAFVEHHACCSVTPSTPIVLRRRTASRPTTAVLLRDRLLISNLQMLIKGPKSKLLSADVDAREHAQWLARGREVGTMRAVV